jgi:formylglycine-generating enzyme required for sulfatase activity
VGAYPSNNLGLCDMHGNVWQWCEDSIDPKGSGGVIRGGGWSDYGEVCRAAFRSGVAPASRSFGLGLRLARVPRPASGPASQGERPRRP